jgi:hypothetical protein
MRNGWTQPLTRIQIGGHNHCAPSLFFLTKKLHASTYPCRSPMLATPSVCPAPVNHNHGSQRNDDLLTPQQLWFPPTAFFPSRLTWSDGVGPIMTSWAYLGNSGILCWRHRRLSHYGGSGQGLENGASSLPNPKLRVRPRVPPSTTDDKVVLDQSPWPILIVVSTDKASLGSLTYKCCVLLHSANKRASVCESAANHEDRHL